MKITHIMTEIDSIPAGNLKEVLHEHRRSRGLA